MNSECVFSRDDCFVGFSFEILSVISSIFWHIEKPAHITLRPGLLYAIRFPATFGSLGSHPPSMTWNFLDGVRDAIHPDLNQQQLQHGKIHIQEILLMVQKSSKLTSWYGKYPIFSYRVSYILGGAEFLPSTVCSIYPELCAHDQKSRENGYPKLYLGTRTEPISLQVMLSKRTEPTSLRVISSGKPPTSILLFIVSYYSVF